MLWVVPLYEYLFPLRVELDTCEPWYMWTRGFSLGVIHPSLSFKQTPLNPTTHDEREKFPVIMVIIYASPWMTTLTRLSNPGEERRRRERFLYLPVYLSVQWVHVCVNNEPILKLFFEEVSRRSAWKNRHFMLIPPNQHEASSRTKIFLFSLVYVCIYV